MVSKNGNGASVSSALFDRLSAGMAAVTPLAEPRDTMPRDPGEESIGRCDEFLIRLYTYHVSLIESIQPIEREVRMLERKLLDVVGAFKRKSVDVVSLFGELEKFMTEENRACAARLAELKAKIQPEARYVKWVGDLFWAEARSRLPALEDPSGISLRADWTFVAETENDEDESDTLAALAQVLGRRASSVGMDA